MTLSLLKKFGPLALIIAVFAIGYVRIGVLKEKVQNRDILIAGLTERNELYSEALQDREDRIKQQNDSITLLAARSEQGRTVYLQGYAKAEKSAQSHYDNAAEILALQSEFTDELAECRASKLLLQKELLP